MIPAEAVEAAAEYLPHSDDCEVRPERDCTCWQLRVDLMREALEAAAPHIRAQALLLADKWQTDFPYKAQELRAALGVTND